MLPASGGPFMPSLSIALQSQVPGWTAIIVLVLGLSALVPAPAIADAPTLAVDDARPAAGYFHLSWEAGHRRPVELEEATVPGFSDTRLVYRGPDSARVMSGKPDGTWYYRVRRIDGGAPSSWSEPVAVEVRHHSLQRAGFFFVLGAVVFGATLVLVLIGQRLR